MFYQKVKKQSLCLFVFAMLTFNHNAFAGCNDLKIASPENITPFRRNIVIALDISSTMNTQQCNYWGPMCRTHINGFLPEDIDIGNTWCPLPYPNYIDGIQARLDVLKSSVVSFLESLKDSCGGKVAIVTVGNSVGDVPSPVVQYSLSEINNTNINSAITVVNGLTYAGVITVESVKYFL